MGKYKVIFKFDKEKDLFNIWETCNKDSNWYDHKKNIHPMFLDMCEGKEFNEIREELGNYRKRMHDSGLIELFVDAVQKAWDKINDEFFKRLKKVMKKPFKFEKINAYATTVVRCPYDYKEPWFMFSFFRDIPNVLNTCGHELMHIHFHNTYWSDVEKQIGKKKTADLKEALTVLLNLEFKDLWFVEDKGYDIHKKLRKFIEKEWKEEKNFEKLLNKCIKHLKK